MRAGMRWKRKMEKKRSRGAPRERLFQVEVIFDLFAMDESDAADRVSEIVESGQQAESWVQIEGWETVRSSQYTDSASGRKRKASTKQRRWYKVMWDKAMEEQYQQIKKRFGKAAAESANYGWGDSSD